MSSGSGSSQVVARRMTTVEQFRAEKKIRRLVQLLLGLAGYGSALTFLVQSGLGASSWNVLAEGVAARLGWSFGSATNVIGVVVLVFWVPLREPPGLGTVLNAALVGTCASIAGHFVPAPHGLSRELAYFALGLLMLTFFDAVYLGARFGPGPRDGLMTGAVRISGKPLWLVRTAIEAVVVSAGWMLGGVVGPGTVIIAFLMGPLVQRFLRFTTVSLADDAD
ncbi:MAG: YczE/YyaS/YitT family protein [Streptosporangiaceae bacterium]